MAKTPQIKVDVSLETIFESEQANSSHCMIAESIKKQNPWGKNVTVDLQTCRITDRKSGLRYVYLTPRSAQIALVLFDRGMHTDPFSFLLRNGQVIGKPGTRKTIKTTSRSDGSAKVKGVEGGKAPPKGALADGPTVRGARRTYGLRALDLGR